MDESIPTPPASIRSPTTASGSQRRRGIGRTACTRCKARKQRCDGRLPSCWNCNKAGAECDLDRIRSEDTAMARYVASLENKIARLELQLLRAQPESPSDSSFTGPIQAGVGDVVNALFFGPSEAPASTIQASSLSLARNLGNLVQASVWNKVLMSSAQGDGAVAAAAAAVGAGAPGQQSPNMRTQQPQTFLTLDEIRAKSAGPPSDEEGTRLIEACFSRLNSTYPFLDAEQIWEVHRHREVLSGSAVRDLSKKQRFRLFQLYLVYAIGAGMLALREKHGPISPEAFYMTALQHAAAARESRSLENIEAMSLLVIFHLRSAVSHGLWYMIGLAMRTCIDLGLHLGRREVGLHPAVVSQRRKLFWSVYCLDRNISIALGYPVSVPDSQIDVDLPAVSGEEEARRLRPALELFGLKRLESRIYHSIYRADKPLDALLPKVQRHYQQLQEWKATMLQGAPPDRGARDTDYLLLHHYRTVRLLTHPFLSILKPADPYYRACLNAAGRICQLHKRLHQNSDYGHSFIAVQTVFVSGITMLYCLWTKPHEVWSVRFSNDIRACSSVLFVMGERAPEARKYRDAFETLVNATMERLQREDRGDDPMPAGGEAGIAGEGSRPPGSELASGTAAAAAGAGAATGGTAGAAPASAPAAGGLGIGSDGFSNGAVIPSAQNRTEATGNGNGAGDPSHFDGLPPPLQVLQDRWMEFDATAVLNEMANWIEMDTGPPMPWMQQTYDTFPVDGWEQAMAATLGTDDREMG